MYDATITIHKSSIPSQRIDVSKNQVHNGIDYHKESIPWNQCLGPYLKAPTGARNRGGTCSKNRVGTECGRAWYCP